MDEEELTAGRVIEAVKAGDFDGNLVEIIEAVRVRFQFGSTEQKWKVTYDGEDITQDSLTLAEASFVEKQAGTSWAYINPTNSAGECQAIIAMHLHFRHGKPRKEAVEEAGRMNLEAAVDAVGSYEVERAPKGSAA